MDLKYIILYLEICKTRFPKSVFRDYYWPEAYGGRYGNAAAAGAAIDACSSPHTCRMDSRESREDTNDEFWPTMDGQSTFWLPANMLQSLLIRILFVMISFPANLLKTRNVDTHFAGSKADQGVEASKRSRHRITTVGR